MIYPLREYGRGIEFSSNTLNDPAVAEMIDKIDQRNRCALHCMVYSCKNEKYRKYRRGKNRCRYCGVKIKSGRK